jgi:hypothetical protein
MRHDLLLLRRDHPRLPLEPGHDAVDRVVEVGNLHAVFHDARGRESRRVREAVTLERQDGAGQLLPHGRRLPLERLIEQEELGPAHQGPGEGDQLLQAAAEAGGSAPDEPLHLGHQVDVGQPLALAGR